MRAALRFALAGLLLLPLGDAAWAQLPGQLPRTPGAAVPAAPREATPPRGEARPALPTLRLGALLPLSGPGAWFGKEMRQGMEMAIADVNRPPKVEASESGKTAPEPERTGEPLPTLGVTLALETADVQPLDMKHAADEFNRLAALGTPAVFTASATPTLAILPLAAARDVLVVHLGAVTARLPAASRTLLHARPPVAARVDALLAAVAEQKVRRLALLAAGDEFGKAVRAAVSARWHERGGSLAYEESLTLDTPDLPARIRHLARLAPEAIVLGFRGADLGDLAARLREGGYAGRLYLLDDDPAVLLAAGPTLRDAVVVSDAFIGEPGSPAARFADAYKKRFGQGPSRYAAEAYDAVVILATGIAAATAEGRPTPGGGRLREALVAARSFPSVGGGRAVFMEGGTLARPLALLAVEAGKLAFIRHLPPPGQS